MPEGMPPPSCLTMPACCCCCCGSSGLAPGSAFMNCACDASGAPPSPTDTMPPPSGPPIMPGAPPIMPPPYAPCMPPATPDGSIGPAPAPLTGREPPAAAAAALLRADSAAMRRATCCSRFSSVPRSPYSSCGTGRAARWLGAATRLGATRAAQAAAAPAAAAACCGRPTPPWCPAADPAAPHLGSRLPEELLLQPLNEAGQVPRVGTGLGAAALEGGDTAAGRGGRVKGGGEGVGGVRGGAGAAAAPRPRLRRSAAPSAAMGPGGAAWAGRARPAAAAWRPLLGGPRGARRARRRRPRPRAARGRGGAAWRSHCAGNAVLASVEARPRAHGRGAARVGRGGAANQAIAASSEPLGARPRPAAVRKADLHRYPAPATPKNVGGRPAGPPGARARVDPGSVAGRRPLPRRWAPKKRHRVLTCCLSPSPAAPARPGRRARPARPGPASWPLPAPPQRGSARH
jgi:hypothetical protein